jgi:hypothetical protein
VTLFLNPNLPFFSSCSSTSTRLPCPCALVLTPRRPRRDAILQAPDAEESRKNPALPAPTPTPLLLPPPVQASAPAAAAKPKGKGFLVGAAAARKVAAKGGRPPVSPTSTAAAAQKVRNQHLKRSLG